MEVQSEEWSGHSRVVGEEAVHCCANDRLGLRAGLLVELHLEAMAIA